MSVKKFPTLFKRTAGNKVEEWQVEVRGSKDGPAEIVTIHGLVDGKKQTVRDQITEGKRLGTKAETTAWEQALAEAASAWRKKRDRDHYGEDAEARESAEKLAVAPMLAHKYEDHAGKVDWSTAFVQRKYDGNRLLARCEEGGKITLWSRKGVRIVTLPHIVDALGGAIRTGEIMDGEAYVHQMHVTNLRSLLTRKQDGCEAVQFRVYDLVTKQAFSERLLTLASRLAKHAPAGVGLVETICVRNEKQLLKFEEEFIAEGYEGAMLRWGDLGYEAGKRSQSLLKCKQFQDAEFKIVGVKQGRGNFQGMAIFICETPAGHRFDVTAPGTHLVKKQVWQNRDDCIGNRVTVKFAGYTETEEPVPFHPVAIAIRD